MRLFAICPRIREEYGRVVATTAWRVRLLLLGAVFRKVVIDPSYRTISMSSRYLWLIRRRRKIPFSEVAAVIYGYEDLTFAARWRYAHDSFDRFKVGLRLRDDSEVRLFNFIGEGSFASEGPFPDWMYWGEHALDVTGSQENESHAFVSMLASHIGVKVAPPDTW